MAEQLREIEINLYDCLEIMRKRKKIIIFILAVSVFISFGMLQRAIFLRPGMFEIAMFFEPGVIETAENGKKIQLDSADTIDKKIKDKVYRWQITEQLKDRFPGVDLNFDVSNPKGTNLVKIVSLQRKSSVTRGIDLMNYLFVEISNDNEEKIKNRQREIKLQLEDISKTIELKENTIEFQKKTLEIFKSKEEKLTKKINAIEDNIKELKPLRKAMAEKENEISVNFLSPDIVLNNITYLRDLENQYDEMLSERGEITLISITTLENELRELKRRKENMSLKRADICNVSLYREPKVERFVFNHNKLAYPIGGTIVGLIIGVFAVLSMESWRKYKADL